MDEMVLKAQRWVNATYGSVSGYVRCSESGKTGWATMYSLTRALQHELGIASLTDNFGPTTLSRLTAHGKVGRESTNKNIRVIAEAALYCKGYSGGGLDGEFNGNTLTGLTSLHDHLGLGGGLVVTAVAPKVFKALLTMDAYVLLSKGNEYKRQIQQWMNQSYGGRQDFFYGPCDGLPSREVHKRLLLAVQYEIGMADGTANGNVGPGTIAGLKAKALVKVGQRDSGGTGFVRLFQAAFTFNDQDGHWSDMAGTFDTRLQAGVKRFQEFAKLPQSGEGDFQTWMSLLQSTGDPDRKGKAMDCALPLNRATIASVKAAGYQYAGRYITGGTNKILTSSEIALILDNNMSIFPLYQEWGDEPKWFSYDQGRTAGQQALSTARKLGIPHGTVLYFSVDFDAQQHEIDSGIIPHFRGIRDAVSADGNRYAIGVYGCRNVCIDLQDAGMTTRSFVSGMSTSYSGNLGYSLPANWSFDQISNFKLAVGTPGEVEIDNNIVSGRDLGFDSVTRPRELNDAFYTYLIWLEARAFQWREKGHRDRSEGELVAQYLRFRSGKYDFPYSGRTFGTLDKDFVEFAHTYPARPDKAPLRDPSNFWDSDDSHFGASFGAVLNHTIPNRESVSLADMGGWGGDLLSSLGDVLNSGVPVDQAHAYALAHIASAGTDSFFSIGDFLADVDAFILGAIFRARPDAKLSTELRELYANASAAKGRFGTFYYNRFNSSRSTLLEASKAVFYQHKDPEFAAVRSLFWLDQFRNSTGYQTVEGVPDGYKDAVARAFADVVERFAR